jgi:hypothetical protein
VQESLEKNEEEVKIESRFCSCGVNEEEEEEEGPIWGLTKFEK